MCPTAPKLSPEPSTRCIAWASAADSITVKQATNPTNLQKYPLVVIPAATALDGPEITAALDAYVRKGGKLVILPFTGYQDYDGVFRGDGFGRI